MEVHLGAGAVVDLATSDEITSSTNKLVDAIAGSGDPNPLYITQQGVRTGQSAEPIYLGSPPMGRMWFVVGVSLSGVDPFATVAGAFCLCVGDVNNHSAGNIRLPGLTAPLHRSAGTDALWVNSTDDLYLLTSAVAVGVSLICNVNIQEWNIVDKAMTKAGMTPLA